MMTGQRTVRSVGAGMCLVVAASLLGGLGTAPAHAAHDRAGRPGPSQVAGAGDHDVRVKGPSHMVLRNGCREKYSLTVSFDATAGEDYWVNLRGQDSQGHSIDGSTVSGTATSTGRVAIKRPLLLCGSTHDAGVGKLQVNVHVGAEQVKGVARTVIRYADRIRMKRPKVAVRRGQSVLLRGRWDRGPGFGFGCGYYNRKAVRVRIWFKPYGGAWRQVAKARINGQGAWHKLVKVKRSGRYQVRVKKSNRYLPARSTVRRVRAR